MNAFGKTVRRLSLPRSSSRKDGVIVHREAETFDRKPAANAWIVKREAELKRPGELERKEVPTLAAVIDRYIAESKNVVHGTKAQVFKTLKSSDLGEVKCSEITSRTLVSFAQDLNKNMEPQTCGNYFSHHLSKRRPNQTHPKFKPSKSVS